MAKTTPETTPEETTPEAPAPKSEREERSGFVLKGKEDDYIPWVINDGVRDLILIDLVTGGMATAEFYAATRTPEGRGRGPVLLGMMAVSIRAAHPDWGVKRIEQMIDTLDWETVEFVRPDETEKEQEDPPGKSS